MINNFRQLPREMCEIVEVLSLLSIRNQVSLPQIYIRHSFTIWIVLSSHGIRLTACMPRALFPESFPFGMTKLCVVKAASSCLVIAGFLLGHDSSIFLAAANSRMAWIKSIYWIKTVYIYKPRYCALFPTIQSLKIAVPVKFLCLIICHF